MKVSWIIILLCAALLFAKQVQAETCMDIYFGQASTSAAKVTASSQGFFGSFETETRDVSFDNSFETGFNAIFWNDMSPRNGAGIGLTIFEASSREVDVNLLSFSISYMHRLTLGLDEEYELGRFQPYIGIGFLVYWVNVDVDFTPVMSSTVEVSGEGLGFDVRAGMRWMLTPATSLFCEIRYTSMDVDATYEFLGAEQVKVSLDTKHIAGGFSWNF